MPLRVDRKSFVVTLLEWFHNVAPKSTRDGSILLTLNGWIDVCVCVCVTMIAENY